MKPAWDKLMAEFKDSKTALVGDADCTAAGQSLCNEVGVRGYPTIKYGDPNNLEDYKGGRDFDSLKKFAEENLGPTCGPANLDLCDDEKKAAIAKFSGMSSADLEAAIKEKTEAFTDKSHEIIIITDGIDNASQDPFCGICGFNELMKQMDGKRIRISLLLIGDDLLPEDATQYRDLCLATGGIYQHHAN